MEACRYGTSRLSSVPATVDWAIDLGMRRLNPAYLAALYERVQAAPFPHHISLRLVEITADRCRIELEAATQHLQPFGIVHGGVIATLVDTATFWAAFAPIPEDAGLVNVDLKLNYLEPANPGLLIAEGSLVRGGRTVSYAEATIRTGDGKLVARGASTLMVLPGKGIAIPFPKFL